MTKETNLIYLDRNRFDFYSDVQNQLYNFDLSTFVVNLEIINQAGLAEQVKSFVEMNKVPIGNIMIVLAEPLLFMKAIPPETEEKEEEDIQKFQDSVPFEHIISKTFPIEGGKLLVASNKEYYNAIEKCFSKCGFTTTVIVPIFSTQTNIAPGSPIDPVSAKNILKNAETIRVSGMEAIESETTTSKPQVPNSKGSSNKSRLFMLVGVFGVLIIVLLFVTINALKPEPQKPKNPNLAKPAASPTPGAKSVEIASASGSLVQNIKIKLYTPQNSPNLPVLRNNLTTLGFLNIENDINKSASANPIIVFAPTVNQQIKTQITNIVAQVSTNYVIQEAANPEADVLIFLNN